MGWKIVAQGNGNRIVKKLLQLQPSRLLLHLFYSLNGPFLSPDKYKAHGNPANECTLFRPKIIMTPAGKLIAGFFIAAHWS